MQSLTENYNKQKQLLAIQIKIAKITNKIAILNTEFERKEKYYNDMLRLLKSKKEKDEENFKKQIDLLEQQHDNLSKKKEEKKEEEEEEEEINYCTLCCREDRDGNIIPNYGKVGNYYAGDDCYIPCPGCQEGYC